MTVRLETVEIPVEGRQRLDGTVLSPAERIPGVLFVHGWGGCQAHDLSRAREVAGLGAVCLTFDLRGNERWEEQRRTVNQEPNHADLRPASHWLVGDRNQEPNAH